MEAPSFIVPSKEITLAKLDLRPPRVSDAEEIFMSYAGNKEATRYLSWKTKENISEVEDFVRRVALGWEANHSYTWLALENKSIIGCIAFRPARTGYEIGYVITPARWGSGLGTELVSGMIAIGLSDPAVQRIWAYCDTENRASIKLLEKVGMEKEGLLKKWGSSPNLGAGPRDQFIYAKIRD